ncbi:DUF4270 family protein [Sphingobacterium rhinopitheci]|uniref:DUF4270 family protein n=1 Tax=Sphingobacterium rhinopitheci TaxID=2781960 RepID=UPI001F5200AF|nr:DUF4270 family protein [Sphingobacterium rhinopitheci]MCI0921447.1 DUF4270 family protein [Sphingobacterium rhinopitheci]
MSQLLHFRILFICSLLIGTTTFYSCNKDTSISLGKINENFGVVTVDSMSVFTSTYQLLNMPSAATGVVLVGKSTQADIGTITSKSYMNLIFEALGNDIPENATFDSVNVVLKPSANRYYYGDTTKVQSIAIHRVTEEIKTEDLTTSVDNFNTPVYVTGPTIFNTKNFTYDSSPLGDITFSPNVKSLDSIAIKLDHAFGKDLYDKIITNDWNVSSNELLLQYLKGIVIVPDANNSALLGLSDTVNLNINYSYIGSDGFVKTGKKSLVSLQKAYQFNNIEYDRTGTPFASINNSNRELKSTATNGEVLIQSGSGLVAKVNIPSLNDFLIEPDIAINKIELIVETTGINYGFYPSPNALMILVANGNGIPFSYVTTPFSNTIQSATFTPGNGSGVNGKYIFNLIEYVKLVNTPSYKDASLLLATTSPALFNTANAAFIATENGKPKIKLNIVYTKFR